jgi:hypothetical protein
MKNLTLVLVLSMAAFGCGKKKDAASGDPGSAAASGAAMAMGSGSDTGSSMAGSGSSMAAAGSGSAAPTMAAGDGGACGTALDHAISLEQEHMKKDIPGITDAQIKSLRDLAVKHCNDDKWGPEALKCYGEAKTAEDGDNCDAKLDKDQKEKFNKDMETAMAPMAGSGAGGAASPKAELPKECADYKAAAEKIATCDKLSAADKDGMAAGLKAAAEGWTSLDGMPPDAVKAMTTGCAKSLEAVNAAGKKSCGWK